MAATIERLEGVLQDQRHSPESMKEIEEFEKASEGFEMMIKEGIISHRGFRLLSIEDAHLNINKYAVNSSSYQSASDLYAQ